MKPEIEVLIVGAGPTGLVLALWLSHLGVKVRIVDKAAEPGTTSRALAVHARILEFYDQISLAREIVDQLAGVTDLFHRIGNKLLAAKTRIHRHDQKHICEAQSVFDHRKRSRWID